MSLDILVYEAPWPPPSPESSQDVYSMCKLVKKPSFSFFRTLPVAVTVNTNMLSVNCSGWKKGLKSWTVVFRSKKNNPRSCRILPFISFLPLSSVPPRPSLSLLHIKDTLLIQKRFVCSFYVSQLDGSISCLSEEEERGETSVFREEETPNLDRWSDGLFKWTLTYMTSQFNSLLPLLSCDRLPAW